MINISDNYKKLVLVKILRSISVPGQLQTFFSVGTDNPKSSFFNAFSPQVLQAAFNIDQDSVEILFGQRNRTRKQEPGMFKKASKEQIQSMIAKEKSWWERFLELWPLGIKESPYNIFGKKPSVQNDYGSLHEVDSNDYFSLHDINVAVSFFSITKGGMAGPFYNSNATATVLVVSNGEGRYEMACPHLWEQISGGGRVGPGYAKVSSEIRRGNVVVVPAGHPIVIEAVGNQNLEVVSFRLNSDKNEWFPLAGTNNVTSHWEDEAMALTFGFQASEVRKLIQKQNGTLFFKGPVSNDRAFA